MISNQLILFAYKRKLVLLGVSYQQSQRPVDMRQNVIVPLNYFALNLNVQKNYWEIAENFRTITFKRG